MRCLIFRRLGKGEYESLGVFPPLSNSISSILIFIQYFGLQNCSSSKSCHVKIWPNLTPPWVSLSWYTQLSSRLLALKLDR